MAARSTSKSSQSFRESTHLIPTPGADGKKIKRYDPLIMKWPVIIGTPILMLGLGIALEVGIFLSNKKGGFAVPQKNVFSSISTQFLLSFFPTLFVIPVAFLWRELDSMLRRYQPYVLLSKGNVRAEETLLLDYSSLGPISSLFRALYYKHRIIFWSAITATATFLLQPLAGSIFQIRTTPQFSESSVTSTKTIGLVPDVSQLNAFVAAAGFAEAAAFHGLPDPPFVQGGWATAEFVFPNQPFLNGTMTVNTTGIQTVANCSNPVKTDLNPIPGNNTLQIVSTSVDGCVNSVSLDDSAAAQQYGVGDITCGDNAKLDVEFRPVMFWFVSNIGQSNPEAKTVFCTPSIQAFNVLAVANLNNGSLLTVSSEGNYVSTNNVTGGQLNGKAFNGVVFDPSPDPFIQARATATQSGVPGAIFRFASQLPNGPQSTFDLPNGFLDITRTIYTLHLALTAKSIYFVGVNQPLPAELTSLLPRLWIDPLPAHALAVILMSIGFIGIFLHVINRRQRQSLFLATQPGSIASVVSLTSRSGFGELLLPYDDTATLEHKLSGLRFRLDKRTGAIVADDGLSDGHISGRDDAMLSLLGRHGSVPEPHDEETPRVSSFREASDSSGSLQSYPLSPIKYPPSLVEQLKSPSDHP